MMGYAVTAFRRAGSGQRFEHVALTLSAGILINYCLMLTGQTIARVFIAGMLLAMWGAVRFFRAPAGPKGPALQGAGPGVGRVLWDPSTVFSLCCVVYILGVYYLVMFSEPLLHWDARSIWFFHAKMIWTEGALRQHAGWNHPSLAFSHPDYPKLIPAIAAQLAYLKGYWNEFLPKGSLLVMLVPLSLWVFSFRQKSATFILLVLMFFFGLGAAWLTNGYMDGYLAGYCGVALLSFGRYLSESRDTDLYSGVCASGIAASIKNEGLLFGACLIAALFLVGATSSEWTLSRFAKRIRTDSQLAIVLILSIVPTLMWTIDKRAWGLQNDLAGDPSAAFSRLSTRLLDGFSAQYVLSYLTLRATTIWIVLGLLAVIVIFSLAQRLTLHRGALVAAATAALYVGGLYIVYLSTPLDLTFHLSTSAARTMATGSLALFVSMFFLLSSLEAKG